jgi:hypothetical protein
MRSSIEKKQHFSVIKATFKDNFLKKLLFLGSEDFFCAFFSQQFD